jgi:hypothetical protein
MKKNSEPGTEDWFKTWRTMSYLTKGRKNHYMLPIKEEFDRILKEHGVYDEWFNRMPTKYKESWSAKYKKSIDCNNPKGFSQKAHCAGKKKRK